METELEPIAETLYGTPVYHVMKIPEGIVTRKWFRKPPADVIPHTDPFAQWANGFIPKRPSVFILKYGKVTRVFKVCPTHEIYILTARSIREDDRKRLSAAGILR